MQTRPFLGAALAAAYLAGCATFSPDGGMNEVRTMAQQRIGAPANALGASHERVDVPAARATHRGCRGRDRAPQQSWIAGAARRLGIAEADLGAGRNAAQPGVRLHQQAQRRHHQIERTILVNVAALVSCRSRSRSSKRRLRASQGRRGGGDRGDGRRRLGGVLSRRGGAGNGQYYAQVKCRRRPSSELARRMAQVGNWSKLAQMREQVVLRRRHRAARARAAVGDGEREQLTRMLGLHGSGTRRAAACAPARSSRCAVRRCRRRANRDGAPARRAEWRSSMRRAWRVARTRPQHAIRQRASRSATPTNRDGRATQERLRDRDRGAALRLGRRRASRAPRPSIGRRSRAQRRSRSTRAPKCARRYAAYRTAYDLAKHYRDEIVPLRKRIADENVLRYNGMLIGVFELLADARDAGRRASTRPSKRRAISGSPKPRCSSRSPASRPAARCAEPRRGANDAAPAGGH